MKVAHIVLGAALAGVVAGPAAAAEGAAWTLRFHGALVESSAARFAVDDGAFSSSVQTGGGIGVGAEVRLTERLGLELAALHAGLEIGARASTSPARFESFTLGMTPLTVGLPIHFHTGGRIDLYVAPSLNLVRYTGNRMTIATRGVAYRIDAEHDLAPGIALGLDVPFGKGRWAASLGLRYLRTAVDGNDVDPLIVAAGLAYRF